MTKASTSDKAFGEYSDEQLAYLAQSGDRDAEYVLVERFMGLVKLKARPYFLMGADRADLIQEGAIGLVAAIREYEPDRGGSFRSFAETCIVRQIYSAIRPRQGKSIFRLTTMCLLTGMHTKAAAMRARALSWIP